MDRDPILQRDDPQVATAKLRAGSPESISVMLLGLRTHRTLDNSNAPFLLDIGALPQNLIFEVLGKPISRHVSTDIAMALRRPPLGAGPRPAPPVD